MRRAVLLTLLLAACSTSSLTDEGEVLTETQLKYELDDRYDVFYCDPDEFPIVLGDEQERAIERYAAIAGEPAKLGAILEHLGWSGRTDFSPAEKLKIYREEKRLASIVFEPAGSSHSFRFRETEASGIYELSGTIGPTGRITVRERAQSSNVCPICLSGETRIATAAGDLPVHEVAIGMLVWSLDADGARVLAPVARIGRADIPVAHVFVHLVLADGRTLLASPGHPVVDGRRLHDLAVGDIVDGSVVIRAERTQAERGFTYDLLPASATGVYWANGVPLRSTLTASATTFPTPALRR